MTAIAVCTMATMPLLPRARLTCRDTAACSELLTHIPAKAVTLPMKWSVLEVWFCACGQEGWTVCTQTDRHTRAHHACSLYSLTWKLPTKARPMLTRVELATPALMVTRTTLGGWCA